MFSKANRSRIRREWLASTLVILQMNVACGRGEDHDGDSRRNITRMSLTETQDDSSPTTSDFPLVSSMFDFSSVTKLAQSTRKVVDGLPREVNQFIDASLMLDSGAPELMDQGMDMLYALASSPWDESTDLPTSGDSSSMNLTDSTPRSSLNGVREAALDRILKQLWNSKRDGFQEKASALITKQLTSCTHFYSCSSKVAILAEHAPSYASTVIFSNNPDVKANVIDQLADAIAASKFFDARDSFLQDVLLLRLEAVKLTSELHRELMFSSVFDNEFVGRRPRMNSERLADFASRIEAARRSFIKLMQLNSDATTGNLEIMKTSFKRAIISHHVKLGAEIDTGKFVDGNLTGDALKTDSYYTIDKILTDDSYFDVLFKSKRDKASLKDYDYFIKDFVAGAFLTYRGLGSLALYCKFLKMRNEHEVARDAFKASFQSTTLNPLDDFITARRLTVGTRASTVMQWYQDVRSKSSPYEIIYCLTHFARWELALGDSGPAWRFLLENAMEYDSIDLDARVILRATATEALKASDHLREVLLATFKSSEIDTSIYEEKRALPLSWRYLQLRYYFFGPIDLRSQYFLPSYNKEVASSLRKQITEINATLAAVESAYQDLKLQIASTTTQENLEEQRQRLDVAEIVYTTERNKLSEDLLNRETHLAQVTGEADRVVAEFKDAIPSLALDEWTAPVGHNTDINVWMDSRQDERRLGALGFPLSKEGELADLYPNFHSIQHQVGRFLSFGTAHVGLVSTYLDDKGDLKPEFDVGFWKSLGNTVTLAPRLLYGAVSGKNVEVVDREEQAKSEMRIQQLKFQAFYTGMKCHAFYLSTVEYARTHAPKRFDPNAVDQTGRLNFTMGKDVNAFGLIKALPTPKIEDPKKRADAVKNIPAFNPSQVCLDLSYVENYKFIIGTDWNGKPILSSRKIEASDDYRLIHGRIIDSIMGGKTSPDQQYVDELIGRQLWEDAMKVYLFVAITLLTLPMLSVAGAVAQRAAVAIVGEATVNAGSVTLLRASALALWNGQKVVAAKTLLSCFVYVAVNLVTFEIVMSGMNFAISNLFRAMMGQIKCLSDIDTSAFFDPSKPLFAQYLARFMTGGVMMWSLKRFSPFVGKAFAVNKIKSLLVREGVITLVDVGAQVGAMLTIESLAFVVEHKIFHNDDKTVGEILKKKFGESQARVLYIALGFRYLHAMGTYSSLDPKGLFLLTRHSSLKGHDGPTPAQYLESLNPAK